MKTLPIRRTVTRSAFSDLLLLVMKQQRSRRMMKKKLQRAKASV